MDKVEKEIKTGLEKLAGGAVALLKASALIAILYGLYDSFYCSTEKSYFQNPAQIRQMEHDSIGKEMPNYNLN